jgi:predicted nuclease of restriction endonuclease-like RecB superfamily
MRRALAEYRDLAGIARANVDRAWLERIEPRLLAEGATYAAAHGVKHLLDRRFPARVGSAVAPERIREVVFGIAAAGGDRADVLDRAASELGVTAEKVDAWLFADRAAERLLAKPAEEPTPSAMVLEYNLALVQGLLLRAVRLRVVLSESLRAVVRYAKLRGLLAAFREVEDGRTSMEASGPLSLFRNTLKYGRALAGFFPVLTTTPTFLLDAACRVRGRRVLVRVQTGDPLPRAQALPREHDSAVERALTRDVRRLGTGWRLERESAVLRAGARLVFPDFTLRRGDTRVLVEIVGYYTREYLERKAASLRSAGAPHLIVCVDDALDCGEIRFDGASVLRFRRRVDAARLLAMADALGGS